MGKNAQGILQPIWPGAESSVSLRHNLSPLPGVSEEAAQRENGPVESGTENLHKGTVKKMTGC